MSEHEISNENLFRASDFRFLIDGEVGKLELMTRAGDPDPQRSDSGKLKDWLMIICHPHPEHGGTMDNKVVTTLARAAREVGVDSLRFNYRAVGESEGVHGDFVGECSDFDTVIEWVTSLTQKTKLILAGFSFGSAIVATRADTVGGIQHMMLVAPPVERYQYNTELPAPVTIFQGAEDEVLDAKLVTRWVEEIKSPCEYVYFGQCSHFFHGQLVALRRRVVAVLQTVVT